MSIICKYYTILYKGLEYPWILVSSGGSGTNPLRYRGTTVVPYMGHLQVPGIAIFEGTEKHPMFSWKPWLCLATLELFCQ